MGFGIRRMVLGARQSVDLTPEEFERAKRARELLLDAVQIEEKLELVLSNYVEFESELLRLTVKQLVFDKVTWNSMHDDRHSVARRVVNLLTTGRLYIDQVKHDISGLFGNPSQQYADLEQSFRDEYDGLLGYRAMEALRNFVQHRSMPVRGISYNRGRRRFQDREFIESNCTPTLNVHALRAEGGFKPPVLDELDRIADRDGGVDLKPLVREYVGGIVRVQKKLRDRMAAEVRAAENEFQACCDRFRQAHGNDIVGIALVEEGANGVAATPLYLVPDMIDRLKALVFPTKDFRIHFVTSQAASDAQ